MTESPPATEPGHTGSEPTLASLLAVLLPAMLLVVVASDMVTLVLPVMGEDFGASEAQLAWVVTGFLLVFSIGIPLYGRISDRVGLRRLFLVALILYAVGSLICALAPSLTMLVGGRIVMGAGAAAIPVLSIIAVTRLMPPEKRGIGIGFISAAAGSGMAAGPPFGGAIGQALGWPALFWLTTACAVALLPGVIRKLPNEASDSDHRFDLAGGVFLGLAAGLALFSVTQAQDAGVGEPVTWGTALGAVVAIAVFVWRTRRAENPFVPPALFANRVYVAGIITVFLAQGTNLAALVFVPVLVVGGTGLSPGVGSLVMVPGGIAVAVLSPLAVRFATYLRARTLILVGLATVGASTLFLSMFAGASPVFAAGGILGIGMGMALVLTLVTDTVAGSLPPRQVGVGMGVFQGAQFLGAGTGPALAGALLAARSGAEQAINPFYSLGPSAYSDVFLVMALVAAAALVVALRLGATRSNVASSDDVRDPA
ncbi:MFS transporter [Spiractinospora alimapuensis]|uniref:MFS transporter n=1 Tax=Spiractinospora alimapuensis TaxID=2820884 RepID=UPI001F378C0F|nr:MFS transporter [Spiractinospora alimapuensis]QVQ51239.1 MFS transporter [Spiractinospora alimapuensis]